MGMVKAFAYGAGDAVAVELSRLGHNDGLLWPLLKKVWPCAKLAFNAPSWCSMPIRSGFMTC